MKGFIGFTKRNLLLYFKDVHSIIFSLLTSIIVFVLYLLFLKGTFVDAIEGASAGLESFIKASDVEMLVNGIFLVGILGSALITVPYSCLQTIIKDRETNVDYDICATPMKRGAIILSYFTASTLSAFLMTSIIFTVGFAIISGMGDPHIAAGKLPLIYGMILLGSVSSTALFMIVVLAFKSTAVTSAFFGILSAAQGFVIGAYIPISQFSEGVRTFCNLFPASHITVLLRNVILNGMFDNINEKIGGVDNGVFVTEIKKVFSFNAELFGKTLSFSNTALYVGIAAMICIFIMVVLYGKTYKRR